MANTTANSPGTMADDATVGTVAWTNPDNAKVSDNVYATVNLNGLPTSSSHYLKATNFGFSIPTGVTITGILVEVEAACDSIGNLRGNIVKANGTFGTISKSVSTSSIEAYNSLGGSNDLWGETWTVEDINDVDFGVGFWAYLTQRLHSVDHIRITIYYTESTAVIASPGTMADDATVGTLPWTYGSTSPDNAKVSDNVYAKAGSSTAGTYYSHYLKATNFGFAIPAGATIDGILVQIERSWGGDGGASYANEIKIVKADGTIGTTNKADTTNFFTGEPSYTSFGGISDLWDETWDADKINDADFGVVISAKIVKSSRCLEGDTKVWTKSGNKAIKNIKIGESVYSFNEENHQIENDIVTKVWNRKINKYDNKYYYIYLDNGKLIKSTFNHEYYTNEKWKDAETLQIGDVLKNEKLEDVKIVKIDVVKNYIDEVWDLTVKNNHNFFANDILVHNATAAVDHIRITVYYTEATSDIKKVGSVTQAGVKKIGGKTSSQSKKIEGVIN